MEHHRLRIPLLRLSYHGKELFCLCLPNNVNLLLWQFKKSVNGKKKKKKKKGVNKRLHIKIVLLCATNNKSNFMYTWRAIF